MSVLPPQTFSLPLLSILLSLATLSFAANPAPATTADLQLFAVDSDGNRISNLVAGQYVALYVMADLKKFPDKASAALSAAATFKTTILGKNVKYSVSIPVNSSAGSRIDPTVGLPSSGQKLGTELENTVWQERIDFMVPSQVPNGKLTITLRAIATSSKPIVRKFEFNVVRP